MHTSSYSLHWNSIKTWEDGGNAPTLYLHDGECLGLLEYILGITPNIARELCFTLVSLGFYLWGWVRHLIPCPARNKPWNSIK